MAISWTARNYMPIPLTTQGDGDRVTLTRVSATLDSESLTPAAASGESGSTLAGNPIVMKVRAAVQSLNGSAVANNVRIIDVIPPDATMRPVPVSRLMGLCRSRWIMTRMRRAIRPRLYTSDMDAGGCAVQYPDCAAHLLYGYQSLAVNGTNIVNDARILADNILFTDSIHKDLHTITLEQIGSIQLSASVDMPLDDLDDAQVIRFPGPTLPVPIPLRPHHHQRIPVCQREWRQCWFTGRTHTGIVLQRYPDPVQPQHQLAG
ncbi:MAG: hypothetical protein R3E89_06005 [Thiolinea sp.]